MQQFPTAAGVWRPRLAQTTLNALVSLYIMLALNLGFWARLIAQFGGLEGRALIFGLGTFGLTMALLELLGPGALQRPAAALLILIAAAAGYYERNFGVLIDREMIRNILSTTPTEAGHLITGHMILVIFLSGVLPAALVFWPRVTRVRVLHQLWRWPLGVALALLLCVGATLSHYKDYSAMLRARPEVLGSYQPGASLVAGLRYMREQLKGADPVARPYGTDAARGPALAAAKEPVLLVLFVGETLRAQNFGLNGHARDTTPELAARDVIAFQDVTACGTSTAVSLPCMFSGLGRADYSRAAALGRENLVDVLRHAGLDVQWWDNNTGDQGVAKRAGWSLIDKTLSPEACAVECTDEAFLPLIEKTAAGIERDTVLVLHMIGSHGPAYYLRYPEARAAFKPDCRSAQFSDCTQEEITNAYDNSVRETDHVLARSIDILAASTKVTPALMFLSDHGESLGEAGLYLHAAPAFMAPPEQLKVPFLLWLSPAFAETLALDPGCLKAKATAPVSHDNLFPSVLGLLDIRTAVREAALDLTATCQKRDLM